MHWHRTDLLGLGCRNAIALGTITRPTGKCEKCEKCEQYHHQIKYRRNYYVCILSSICRDHGTYLVHTLYLSLRVSFGFVTSSFQFETWSGQITRSSPGLILWHMVLLSRYKVLYAPQPGLLTSCATAMLHAGKSLKSWTCLDLVWHSIVLDVEVDWCSSTASASYDIIKPARFLIFING